MAPTKPSKRTSIRAKAASKSTPTSGISSISSLSNKPHPALSTGHILQSTKDDKRKSRYAGLLSKVDSSSFSSGAITKSSKKNLKRRQNKIVKQNLITGLEGLADALPETTDYLVDQGGRDALNSLRGVGGGFSGKMKMKTIKSKAGAQKRKEKVLREECERFGKNLAVINSGILSAQGASAAGDRKPASALPTPVSSWAALRGFISGTMEKKEEFVVRENAAKEPGDMEFDK